MSGSWLAVLATRSLGCGVGSVVSSSASSSSYSFSPGRKPGVADRDLLLGLAGQPDQHARQVDDLHRLAHVQHEDLARTSHQPGLQHQLRGLRDGHEVAHDLRVRHRHRPAARDLRGEQRHHRAAGPQHVAEAHRHELRAADPAPPRACTTSSARRLLAPMTLVGFTALSVEIITKRRAPHSPRHARRVQRAQHVGAQRLDLVVLLHQRHVLVGGGVEHHGRAGASARSRAAARARARWRCSTTPRICGWASRSSCSSW